MSCGKTYLTAEIRALIGAMGERVETTLWGIEREGLRRFTQAVMDPDPRYWDEDFARTTRYGEVIAPHIYATYLGRTPPGAEDPVTRGFQQDPVFDGLGGGGGGSGEGRRGALPRITSELKRVLNAGNEIEVLQFPTMGDRIFSQAKIANVEERVGRDGSHMLIITNETTFTNQRGERLCITRASMIRR